MLVTSSQFLFNDNTYWNQIIQERLLQITNKIINMEELYDVHLKVSYINNNQIKYRIRL